MTGELYSLAKSTIMNFLDEIEQIGFIPNGARIYYLNRSQVRCVLSSHFATCKV